MRVIYVLLTFTILFTSVNAGFQKGFIAGFILSDFNHETKSKEVTKPLKGNMMTIDTSLCEFPPQKNPICMEIRVSRKLTIIEELISFILMIMVLIVPFSIAAFGSDDDREFMIGYMAGKAYSDYRNRY